MKLQRLLAASMAFLLVGGLASTASAYTPIGRPKVLWGGVSNPAQVLARPGEDQILDITFEVTAPLDKPRLVLQTPNGAQALRVEVGPLPDRLEPGQPQSARVVVRVPPNFLRDRISGRLYLRDRRSVLVSPLNIRVEVDRPAPSRTASGRRGLVSHIRLLPNRFNLNLMTVISGTTLTWINKDARSDYEIRGTLCQFSWALNRRQTCPAEPSVDGLTCNVTDQASGVLPCFASPILSPEGSYSVVLERPEPRQILVYRVEATVEGAPAMTGYVVVK